LDTSALKLRGKRDVFDDCIDLSVVQRMNEQQLRKLSIS
jgi:hypothetical protein